MGTGRAQGTPCWALAAVILQMDCLSCCAAAWSQCHSSSSPGCGGVPWWQEGQASAWGASSGGESRLCVHSRLLQLIAACEAKQVFDILSASALLLESKDKCSLSTGEKPGENLR